MSHESDLTICISIKTGLKYERVYLELNWHIYPFIFEGMVYNSQEIKKEESKRKRRPGKFACLLGHVHVGTSVIISGTNKI